MNGNRAALLRLSTAYHDGSSDFPSRSVLLGLPTPLVHGKPKAYGVQKNLGFFGQDCSFSHTASPGGGERLEAGPRMLISPPASRDVCSLEIINQHKQRE